jgi:hypothetical protein
MELSEQHRGICLFLSTVARFPRVQTASHRNIGAFAFRLFKNSSMWGYTISGLSSKRSDASSAHPLCTLRFSEFSPLIIV